ncbi:unnamed protein product [Mesocestoides corti]|uniref:Uncharacterized protein n=1 Tax=Mesocestoides corti TaxID=53468 RepID=A0A0R3UBH2_MESCO|nr:unnamed protein product [Mesocestoides corti]
MTEARRAPDPAFFALHNVQAMLSLEARKGATCEQRRCTAHSQLPIVGNYDDDNDSPRRRVASTNAPPQTSPSSQFGKPHNPPSRCLLDATSQLCRGECRKDASPLITHAGEICRCKTDVPLR